MISSASIIIIFTIISIYISGSLLWKYNKYINSINPILFGWIWFNIWIGLYETYMVINRTRLATYNENCDKKTFWSEDNRDKSRPFWLDAWSDYACYADDRYYKPNQLVHWIELGNAIIVAILIICILAGFNKMLIVILVIQAYHCFIYFLTLWHYRLENKNKNTNYKTILYLILSAIWIIIPIIIIGLLWGYNK